MGLSYAVRATANSEWNSLPGEHAAGADERLVGRLKFFLRVSHAFVTLRP